MNSTAPIFCDLEGIDLTSEELELLQHPLIGGVVLFTRNYVSRKQLTELTYKIHLTNPRLLIAVDQEGGRVQRFKQEFTLLPPLADFGKQYLRDPQSAKQKTFLSAELMAKELREVGIDFSFAPVLDVDQGVSQIIGDRSFASQATIVCELAAAYIDGMAQAGMIAIGKHFPGHGAVAADSHKELPTDTRDFATIWKIDLLPYSKLKDKLAGIMTAHVIYSAVENIPATFSTFWLQHILRTKIGFKGIIFSDDLSMAGANFAGDIENRVKLALEAGCNKVLICNNRNNVIKVVDYLENVSSTFK